MEDTPGQLSSVGKPNFLKMMSSCLSSMSPGKRGSFVRNSLKNHPTDHMSMDGV